MVKIHLPKKLKNLKQVLLYQWLKDVGTKVEKDSVICVVQAGRDLFGVKSNVSGVLSETLVPAGGVFDADMPIAAIDEKTQNTTSNTEKSSKSGDNKMNQKADTSSVQGTVIPILMPQAGQSMEEGTILSWKVAEGDRIEVGQIIMEIETDKATMEVEAVDAGRIAKIIAAEGAIVEVKVPVAYIAEEGVNIDAYLGSSPAESTAASKAAAAAPKAEAAPAKSSAPSQKQAASISESGRVKASPAARKAAIDKGIDLATVGGSGPGGRVISSDVESAEAAPTEARTYAVTKMRKAIATNLLYSKQNVPHFYAKTTIDAGALFSTYRKTKEQFKCSVNDFITYACGKAIRQYPAFRSQYKNHEITEYPSVNIGIAVGTDDGLTVPVVLDVDKMNLQQLAAKTQQVVESARKGRMEGLGQGVFTITNLGMFGVEDFSAIINPPEAAILAVGAIREGVVVENGAIRPTRLMSMTISADHRVIDGVLAAKFLQTLKELLEKPQQLVS
jgi:pyruvate dehydrogenase E2 component (dihydrolipoamide acetyltransferase)